MAGEISILEAIAKLGEMTLAVKEAERLAMEKATRIVQREAKREIGHYQDQAGQFVAWAGLADSTLADKDRKGYGTPDPLLRTGNMRDSIERRVEQSGFLGVTEGAVGSDSDIAVYQELGTFGPHPGPNGQHIPPRSFLGGAAFRKAEEVAEVLGSGVVAALVGDKVHKGHLPISGGDND